MSFNRDTVAYLDEDLLEWIALSENEPDEVLMTSQNQMQLLQ